jgi:RimJ/RimL family protein N-acetyltransferase
LRRKVGGVVGLKFFKKNTPIKEKIYTDKKRELEWVVIDRHNKDKYSACFDDLKKWSKDSSIQRYISVGFPLDELFKSFIPKRDDQDEANVFFCMDDGKFVGLTMVSSPFGLNKHSTIEYLIVNPELRKKGYGTRMVGSVTSNPKFFAKGDKGFGFVSSVESDNIPSKKAFLKNKFKVVKHVPSFGRLYSVLYFGQREECLKEASNETIPEF